MRNLIPNPVEFNHALVTGRDFSAQLRALDIPPTVRHELAAHGVRCASDLMQWPQARLMRLQHVGKSFAERLRCLVEMA